MTIFEAIIQGIIQGATEFLPVSSSGHLSISKHLFGIELPGILFDIMLHLGTLIAVAGTDDVASAYAVSSRSLAPFAWTLLTAISSGAR